MGSFEDYVEKKRIGEKNEAGQPDAEPKFDFEIEEELNQAQFINVEMTDEERQEAMKEALNALYDGQKKKSIGNEGMGVASAAYVDDILRERMEQTSFAERTEYYFKDHNYLNAKVERYTSLGSDENKELNIYAKKYTNRNARKRKARAKDAAKSFRKAKNLELELRKRENRNGGEPLPAIEIYLAHNDIMRARMEGMINAAKAKATDSQNEAYRIAKAKLSCLSNLYDQARNLQDKASRDDFTKIQEGLLKEIADAQTALKKSKPKIDAEWKDSLGVNDQALINKIKKESENPYVKDEDVKLSLVLQSLSEEAQRHKYMEVYRRSEEVFGVKNDPRPDVVAFGLDYVKRDKNGNPINKEEMRKDQWNHKWVETLCDKNKGDERRRMIAQAFKRIKDIEMPTPSELRKNGAVYYLKKDMCKYYSLICLSLHIDNVRPLEPFAKEYFEADRVLKAKFDASVQFVTLLIEELRILHNIHQGSFYSIHKGDRFLNEGDADDIKKARKEERESLSGYIDEYEKLYPEITKALEAEKPITKEEAFKRARRSDFNEESYGVYSDMVKTSRMLKCPEYLGLYKPVFDRLGTNFDITRVCGSMLRLVHFDANWNPISKEDAAAHEWNLNYLNRLREYHLPTKQNETKDKAQQEIMKMLEEEIPKYFKGQYETLSPEELRKQILEPLQKERHKEKKDMKMPRCEAFDKLLANTDVLWPRLLKVLALEGTYKTMPFMNDFMQSHPELDACQDMYRQYHSILIMYATSTHHVTLDANTMIESMSGNTTGLENVDFAETMIDLYEEAYNKFHNLMKG